jgi:glutaminyl-peptide cyclotransferase
MKKKILMILGVLAVSLTGLISCKENPVKIKKFPKNWHLDRPPVIVFEKMTESHVKSIWFTIDDTVVKGGSKVLDTIVLPGRMGLKLGRHKIKFFIKFNNGDVQTFTKKFTLFASKPPVKREYELIAEYPHDTEAFTQGLEFDGDTLFESTGQYGTSSLRKINFENGRILQKFDFDDSIFAEGLTLWKDSVIVLTWQNKKGFIFNRKFDRIGEFPYGKSKEGWGLCHNDSLIFKSDGTEKIWILDPATLKEKDFINVYAYKSKVTKINELEWIDGKIFTNVWQKNAIAVINPQTGEVEGVIDLSDLLKKVKNHPALDVLNGIAYHKKRGTIFVTGKNWNKIFEIKLK